MNEEENFRVIRCLSNMGRDVVVYRDDAFVFLEVSGDEFDCRIQIELNRARRFFKEAHEKLGNP